MQKQFIRGGILTAAVYEFALHFCELVVRTANPSTLAKCRLRRLLAARVCGRSTANAVPLPLTREACKTLRFYEECPGFVEKPGHLCYIGAIP